ncbi:transmembrane and coiled-coil domain-containing protein 6 [Rhinophrynus dorsalis]
MCNMWQRRKPKHTSLPGIEELRAQRREWEAALRKARREQQLISKRLLRDITEEDDHSLEEDQQSHFLSEQQIIQLTKDLQHGSTENLPSLIALRQGLRGKEARLMFARVDGSMRMLIRLFTCPFANVQMEAARCLHELSHSNEPSVSKVCLPATPYLLTYLSGNSPEFTELCLYTLGNFIVESEAVRNHLLLQGIIPALAQCAQSPHMNVLEALGYALAQLLQSKEAPEKIIPIVLESGLTQDIVRLLLSNSEDWMGVAVEFAWCLHYIVSSHVNNIVLVSQGIVPKLVHFLADVAALQSKAVSPGLELLICPVVRCLGNLLAEVDSSSNQVQIQDGRLLVALFVFMQLYQDQHPFLVRECLWTLNNLTADDPVTSSALLQLNLMPTLLQLLTHSKDASLLVLTILCNIAHLGPAYCEQLRQKGILLSVIQSLSGADVQVTRQSLELLNILFIHCPDLIGDFSHHSGLQILESSKDHPDLLHLVQAIWNNYR